MYLASGVIEIMGIEIGIGTAAKEKPLAVGIDLGTTNSLVAYVKDSVPVVINGPNGKSSWCHRSSRFSPTICLWEQLPEIIVLPIRLILFFP